MILTMISIYLLISLIVSTFLSAYICSSQKGDYTRVLTMLSVAIDIYIFGYLLELSSYHLEQKLFWNLFQYMGIPFVSALWLITALVYTRRLSAHKFLKLFAVFLIPVFTFLLRLTNSFHHLYFISFTLQTHGDLTLLVKEKGIWYYVQSLNSGVSVILSLILFTTYFMKSKSSEPGKVIDLICTSLFSCMGLLLNVTGVGGLRLDFMVLCLPVAMVFIVMAIFRNDFLEVKALAREYVFEKNQEGIVLLNRNGFILDFNEAANAIFRPRNIELSKKPLEAVFGPGLTELMSAPEMQTWKVESQNGIQYYEISTTDITQNGTVLGRIKTIRDNTEIQLRTNYLKLQATIDELSGLLNRREFLSLCQSHLNMPQEIGGIFCLLMLDIDNFKNINDSFGHMAGDAVISALGRLIRQHFRTTDLAGRLGGEEFAVLLKATSLQQTYTKAEQLRKNIEELEVACEAHRIRTTVSLGIAAANGMESIGRLMSRADKALYAAKDSGRNRVSLYHSSSEESVT